MNRFNFFNTTHFLLSFVFISMLFSCEKDELAPLYGSWEVTSFTEDGVEIVGSDISFFEMEYEECDNGEGDFRWTINYSSGGTGIAIGEFECRENDKELELSFRNDDTFEGVIEFDMDLKGKDLVLEATIDGYRYRIVAEK